MTAALKDITIEAFADFALSAACQDAEGAVVPLTGYTAAAVLRAGERQTDVLAVFAAAVDEAGGTITLTLTAEQTGTLQPNTSAFWDLLIRSPEGAQTRLLQGRVKISPAVTRSVE